MHIMLRPILFALIGTLLLPSCGLFKKKKKQILVNSNIRLSGRIQSVNKEDKFVLIRRYGRWSVDEGQVVESRGEGRTANLLPTGEKLGEHIAADIRSGEVEIGDAVYIRQVIKKKKPTSPTTPGAPAKVQNPPQNGIQAPELPTSPPAPTPKVPEKPKNPTAPEDQL